MRKNSIESEVRQRIKQSTEQPMKEAIMKNDNVPYKRGTSTRQNGYGSRLPLFLCLALIVLCLLLIYNLYDVISQRDQYQGELVDSRVQFHSCSANKLECEKKYELSKKTKETDDLRISQLEQSNNEHSSQNVQLKQQLDVFKAENNNLIKQVDDLRDQIKANDERLKSQLDQFGQLSSNLTDAEARLKDYKNNDEYKETELNDLKHKLDDSQQELAKTKEALNRLQENRLSGEGHPLTSRDKLSASASAAVETEVHRVGDQNVGNGASAPNSDSVMPLASSIDANTIPVENLTEPLPPSASDSASKIIVPQSPAAPIDYQTTPPPPLVDDGDNAKELESAVDKSKTDAPSDDDKQGDDTYQDDDHKDQQETLKPEQ